MSGQLEKEPENTGNFRKEIKFRQIVLKLFYSSILLSNI